VGCFFKREVFNGLKLQTVPGVDCNFGFGEGLLFARLLDEINRVVKFDAFLIHPLLGVLDADWLVFIALIG
jgi:hypothetical protein